jgi:hypothetical protein
MKGMFAVNATDVRKEWSAVVDSVIREKPKFIKRTRDYMFLSDIRTVEHMLGAYSFSAQEWIEDNGSVTLVLDQIDLVENGADRQEAIQKLAAGILGYAEDYYADFNLWARGDRANHVPYVFKTLIVNDVQKIGGLIQCRPGEI